MAADAGRTPLRFDFEFQPLYRPTLALMGVTPWTARVTLSSDRLVARFGPFSAQSPVENIRCASQTGPYSAVKAIGARLSLVDSGLTFGTSTRGGVCVLFEKPVVGIDPTGRMRHEGLTLTVADLDGFERAVRQAAGLPLDSQPSEDAPSS